MDRDLFLAAPCGPADDLGNGVARSAKNEPGGRDGQPCKQIHKSPGRLLLCKFRQEDRKTFFGASIRASLSMLASETCWLDRFIDIGIFNIASSVTFKRRVVLIDAAAEDPRYHHPSGGRNMRDHAACLRPMRFVTRGETDLNRGTGVTGGHWCYTRRELCSKLSSSYRRSSTSGCTMARFHDSLLLIVWDA